MSGKFTVSFLTNSYAYNTDGALRKEVARNDIRIHEIERNIGSYSISLKREFYNRMSCSHLLIDTGSKVFV